MTARHSTPFTLESGESGLGIYTTRRDAALPWQVDLSHYKDLSGELRAHLERVGRRLI